MKKNRLIFVAVTCLVFLSFNSPQKKIKILMAGDSTMSVKETTAYPETGWGMPFTYFWDSTVEVINKAMNGRSTKTFISEGRWDALIAQASEGDYVFIEFGHNDESKEKTERYTTPDEYRTNLSRFVDETRAHGATPILLTPVGRRQFDEKGRARQTHEIYSPIVRELAILKKVFLIDLDEISRQVYTAAGVEGSRRYFMHLAPGEHPNYPSGREDNTHFNELGARLIAERVLAVIRSSPLGLKEHIIKSTRP